MAYTKRTNKHLSLGVLNEIAIIAKGNDYSYIRRNLSPYLKFFRLAILGIYICKIFIYF